ncbi:MAG: T9SS type A sorting domain-containing protein [Saprospiraceae bacterium]
MRQFLLILTFAVSTSAFAQTRYLDEVFTDVMVTDTIQFQKNWSVLPAVLSGNQLPPAPTPTYFQAYTPIGDTEMNRPCVILNTTGSYFPQLVGGGLFGKLDDSVVVETAKRFARLGYTAIISEYRKGWNPTALTDVDARTGSLLIASLRGAQDLRSIARYLRGTIANDGNPYGIDGNKLMVMGYGTGGYNAYNNNFLDDASDVNTLAKFIGTNGQPYYIPQAYGDPDGLTAAQLNIPQNTGFSSEVQFSVGIGGAMGDTTWVDADDSPCIGLHSILDQNAPFAVGDVFVPVANNQRLFVINVAGPRATLATANRLGVNSVLDDANAVLRTSGDFLTLRSDALSDDVFTTRDQVVTTLSTENMYPFVTDLNLNLANTYNWVDSLTLSFFVNGFNAFTGDTTSTATRIARDRVTNPNITSPVRAKLVIDTIMGFVVPRAYVALGIGTAADLENALDVVDISPADVDFKVFPNPTSSFSTIEVREDVELQLIVLYDMNGRRLSHATVSGNRYGFDASNLPSGMYTLMVQTSEGVLSERILVD